jgi:tRNA pseudouridine38-40 synthase
VGWQVQPGGRSIQAVVEAALAKMAGHPVVVTASGRTDSGVHALAQVISFDLLVDRPAHSVRDGMNAHLPDDVACVDAARAPEGFDARRWVLRKRYRYAWLDRRARSPWWDGTTWHHSRRLDAEAMDRAAQALVGRHDFTAFRAAGCGAAHAVRTIERASVRRDGDRVLFDVEGNGFLRHMVRIIAGTLTDVGLGARGEDALALAITARTRAEAGRTAPARGLTLMEVVYGDGPRVSQAADDADE